jgi:hypothetical protein
MRTPDDLAKELKQASEGAICCGLAVEFEDTTLFVFGSDQDAAEKLNDMILQGGKPVGFIRAIGEPGHLKIESRTLAEYANDPDMTEYLLVLRDGFFKMLHDSQDKKKLN